jgi:hypothetical protein
MENNFILCYSKSHETSRKPDATGEAAPTSNPVAREGHDLVGSGSTSKVLRKLCFSMAAGLSQGRREGSESQSLPGSSSQAFGTREEGIVEPFAKRSCGFWLQHRPLDHASGGRSNSKVFWNSLSSQSPLATPDRAGMELSETRTSGSGKGREGDRTLEEETLAGNKKKPPHLEPIWPLLMKAGFFSFPIFVGHGHRGERLPSCIIFTGETESRLFPVLPSRPSGDTWGFTSDFKVRILRPLTWGSFCTISYSTFVDMLSSYGTKLLFIEENQSMTSSIAIQGSMWNGSPDMPLSSTPWNLYGPKQNADWPIVLPKEQRNLSECCAVLPDALNVLNVSSGLAYGPLNCLGDDNIFSIIYA